MRNSPLSAFLFCGDHVIIYRLTAADQIHIRIGADISEDIGSLLGMLLLHISAVGTRPASSSKRVCSSRGV